MDKNLSRRDTRKGIIYQSKTGPQYDHDERHSSPPGGYAQRKSEEIPPASQRTPATLPKDEGYRHETDWFQAHERVRQKRKRDMHTLMGPNNMSGFTRHQMLMDVISWILYWGSAHREFDTSLKCLAEFLKYLCGFTTQEEEDWFDGQCNNYYIDLTGRRNGSRYLGCSKKLSNVLRHCRMTSLFPEHCSMNIADCFDQMEWQNPKQYNMSGAQFAAFWLDFSCH